MDKAEQDRLLDLARATGSKDLPLLIKAKVAAAQRVNEHPSDRNMRSFTVASEALDKEVRKLERQHGDDGRVFGNVNKAREFLLEQGFQVSYGKLKADLVARQLAPKRSGGGWTAWALKQYAAAHLTRGVDPSPEADKPVGGEAGEENPGAVTRRTEAHADKLQVQAERERIKLDRERGELVETATVRAELGKRAKAFRLGLEKFGVDMAEDVAALFGASDAAARDLAASLGLGDEALPVIADFMLGRVPRLRSLWAGMVETMLDPYATGHWWTEAMREAWETYEQSREKSDG